MHSKTLAYDYAYRTLSRKNNGSIDHLIVHSSSSEGLKDRKTFLSMLRNLQTLTGQKGVLLKTRKSVASFSSRIGSEISVLWVLRKDLIPKILLWLSSEALPSLSRTERVQKVDSAPYTLDFGIEPENGTQKLNAESSLLLCRFGVDISLKLTSKSPHKKFLTSYLGMF